MLQEIPNPHSEGHRVKKSQPNLGAYKNQHFLRLQRTLSPIETWGFGFTGHAAWLSVAPAIHAALGPNALFVWLPGVLVGMLINLQVKRLGERSPDMAGGTPNYTTRLLKHYPGLASYAALGYFFSWAATVPINAIVLADLIQVNLEPLGIVCPKTLFKIGFTALPFIVAFSGTRALSILHLFFVVPAFGLLLVFSLQGLGWLAFSPDSPGFFPSSWPHLSFGDWAKWFFFSTYAAYACETASSFVGDSQRPKDTLRFLNVAASLAPPVFLGGSWVLMRLATNPGMGDDAFLNFFAASKHFWGSWAALLVTFLLAAGCLLSCATAVSNCPRILYQLALDGHLSPAFAVVSRRGVLGPALVLTLCLTLICLVWGNVSQIVIVSNVGWFASFMVLHLGLWLRRNKQQVLAPWLSLGFFLVEAVILVVGGLAWSWQDFLIGFLFPIAILAADRVMRRIAFAPFHPTWWIKLYRKQRQSQTLDFVALQVAVLIALLTSATAITWLIRDNIKSIDSNISNNLLTVLLLIVAFVGVAIACWTSLPQVVSIVEAREQAEHLFKIALDAILVLDENGAIAQANPAAESLFGLNASQIIGLPLHELISGLEKEPAEWSNRSEQTIASLSYGSRIVEVAISFRCHQDIKQYVVILRDITDRKAAMVALRESKEQFRQLVEQAADPIYLVETNGKIVDINQRACDSLGYTREELLTLNVCNIDEEWDSEQIAEFAQEIVSGAVATVETSHRRKDGTSFPAEIRIGLYEWGGRQLMLCLVRDITDRKQALLVIQQSEARLRQQATDLEKALIELQLTQTQLIQTEKMSSLGQLVAGVAHEINNPVNFIYGNLTHASDYTQDLLSLIELYQEQYPQPAVEIQDRIEEIDLDFLIEDLPKLLSSMKVGANRICEIVLTLRNFSRIDESHMKPVNIHEGIDSTLVILQNRFKAKPERPAIQIVKKYGNLPDIECYAGQLNQVFMNILANAIDALHQQEPASKVQALSSSITICTQMLNPDWARISIQDNGPGMTEVVKARLFDPFFTTKQVGEGTGLGLSISYQIITDKHGGQLKCFSELGQGTEFQIEIPIRQTCQTQGKATEETSIALLGASS